MKTLSIHLTKTHMSKLLHDLDNILLVDFGASTQAEYQIDKFENNIDCISAFGSSKNKVWILEDVFCKETDKSIEELLLRRNI
jgi:hypothetical protein